ncbi:MAG: vitamin K epoxide reductase family protein [Gemmatimonadaceae bacterium]
MKSRMLIALFALVGALVAAYLTLYKTGAIGDLSCSLGSCETVNTSKWSVFLGLPVAAWGLAAYLVLLGLALLGLQPRFESSRRISLALVIVSGWSMLFSAWLTYLELVVIKAICIWCVTSAVIVVLIFAASLVDLRQLASETDR